MPAPSLRRRHGIQQTRTADRTGARCPKAPLPSAGGGAFPSPGLARPRLTPSRSSGPRRGALPPGPGTARCLRVPAPAAARRKFSEKSSVSPLTAAEGMRNILPRAAGEGNLPGAQGRGPSRHSPRTLRTGYCPYGQADQEQANEFFGFTCTGQEPRATIDFENFSDLPAPTTAGRAVRKARPRGAGRFHPGILRLTFSRFGAPPRGALSNGEFDPGSG